jgi:2-dehydro-3-deoxyphosphogluconate aldolase/(4S)-4-hydroxy-2-oxoglutarate aldolase
MKADQIYEQLGQFKVVPVIAIERAEDALPLADALIEGGLPLAEITFRTAAAADVISTLNKARPELVIGAGTILTTDQLHRAAECGATFGVAPGFNPKVVEEANKIGFAFSPGVMTPSDVEGAVSLGIKVLKFFPAEAAGGVKMLKSLAAPYAHLGIKFIPTGGLNINNMNDYLSIPQVLAIGGTWVAKKDAINDQNWEQIVENSKQAIGAINA